MARYSINMLQAAGTPQNMTTTHKTQLSITAATAGPVTRGKLVDIHVGPAGAPNSTDCSIIWDVSRITTVGTNTATTPVPVDYGGAAAQSVGCACHTAEPTYTANWFVWNMALN